MATAAALLVTSVTYLLVRGDDSGRELTAADDAVTTTSTTEVDTTTTTAESTSTTGVSTPPTPVAPAPPPPTSAARPTTTTAPPPPFLSSIETVTVEELGSSWKPGMGCPAAEQLRALNLSHWDYAGGVRQGRLIVDAAHAERIVAVFRDIYAARFPIERMVPIDAYGGDDQASMRANNTSGFNCRYVAGTTTLSQHGLGRAVDVNPLVNPYVKGSTVDPPEGALYADRSRNDKGMIRAGDAVVKAFAARGWGWGGYWSSGKDYQHFSASGS